MIMTEKEAIHELNVQRTVLEDMILYIQDFTHSIEHNSLVDKKTVLDIAIQALEEIQQYRATGLTPRMIQELKKSHDEAHASAVKNACLLDEYEKIGTLEECRAAVERMKQKKPIQVNMEDYGYTDMYKCPLCHKLFRGIGIMKFCYDCGQAFDWQESEE